jgi:O-antigen/teichoic acid export membrane protein
LSVGSRRQIRELLTGTPLIWAASNLVFANLSGSALGALGFLLAARLYAPADVGVGTALVAATNLLGTVAGLGLESGILRFLPEAGTTARRLVARAMGINGALSVLVGVVFVAGRSTWAVNLPVIDTPFGAAVLVIAVAINALSLLLDSVLVAIRRPGVLSARALGAGAARIIGLIALASYGAWGVFGSWVAASALATLVAAIRVRDVRSPTRASAKPAPNPPSTARVVTYSIRSYAIELAATVPTSAMPLIVISLVGPASTAYYALGALAGGVASGIGRAAIVSLFAEGSHEPDHLAFLSRKALTFAMALLLPITACALIFAEPVLAVFGAGYATEGAWNLRLQVLSVLPSTFAMAFVSVLRVRERLAPIFGIVVLGCAVTLAFAFLLVARLGVSGGGLAILLGQIAMLVVVTPWLSRLLRSSRAANRHDEGHRQP